MLPVIPRSGLARLKDEWHGAVVRDGDCGPRCTALRLLTMG